ncbi:DNA-3-methyladenine glycosylase [Chloroflexota bacterium]
MSSNGSLLTPDFFDRSTLIVSRELLGMRLVRNLGGKRVSGIITETEAYIGETDLGSHAKAGLTARTKVMYGPPGHAFVYFTYGNHWMLSAVTEEVGFPAAVLLRAIQPTEGIEIINANRNGRDTKGPGKLTQALEINKDFNEIDLCSISSGLWIEKGTPIPDKNVTIAPRVGLFSVPEPWKSKPWNFQVK